MFSSIYLFIQKVFANTIGKFHSKSSCLRNIFKENVLQNSHVFLAPICRNNRRLTVKTLNY